MISHWCPLILLVSVHVEVEEIQFSELEGYALIPCLGLHIEETFSSEGWTYNMPSSADVAFTSRVT